jgi:hypothetical protein
MASEYRVTNRVPRSVRIALQSSAPVLHKPEKNGETYAISPHLVFGSPPDLDRS